MQSMIDLKLLFKFGKITSSVLDKITILDFSDYLDPIEYSILSIFISHRTLKGADDLTFQKITSSNILNSFYDHLSASLLFISIKRLPSGYLVIKPYSSNQAFDFMRDVPLHVALYSFGVPGNDVKFFIRKRLKENDKKE